MWHLVPSGMLDGDLPCGSTDFQVWLVARMGLELGLVPSEVGPASFLALVESGAEQGWKPDLVFACRLRLSRSALQDRLGGLTCSIKYSELKFVGPFPFSGECNATTSDTF